MIWSPKLVTISTGRSSLNLFQYSCSRWASTSLPEVLEITFLQTQGESQEVDAHLETWIEQMNEDCFESLIDKILPEGVLRVNPTPDLVY